MTASGGLVPRHLGAWRIKAGERPLLHREVALDVPVNSLRKVSDAAHAIGDAVLGVAAVVKYRLKAST
jgi:hypothetical protein